MADAGAALRALAKHYGVQRAWRASDGSRRVVADEVLVAVLAAMHVEISSVDGAPEALRESREAQLRQMLEPVTVLWDGASMRLTLRLPVGDAANDFVVRVSLEGGETHEFSRRECRVGTPRREGMSHVATIVEPPVRVPFGMHVVTVSRRGHDDASTTVIAAPSHLRERPPGEQRRWGVFAPLYALHDRSREMGDYGSLERMSQWAGGYAADVIATLPLLATFVGAGREPLTLSPYSPVSRRFWNESYIDLASVPEIDGRSAARGNDGGGAAVDLAAIAARRRVELESALSELGQQPIRARAFAQWSTARPDLIRYARFRAAVERFGPGADVQRIAADDPVARYHAYVQWVAAEQLQNLQAGLAERRQMLYLDLPLGCHRDGFDVYEHPELFVTDARIGAPPDEFNPGGQDWGAPPVDPATSRRAGHPDFVAALRAHLSVAGLLRVDHVMGLQRLWWLPSDADAAHGAYVQYPADELYALLCLEADRVGALIVGENLGTVPHETNRALQAHRMLGMYLSQFEVRDDGLAAPGRRTLAALGTHDTPTFARWWHQLDAPRRHAVLGSLHDAGVLDDAVLGSSLDGRALDDAALEDMDAALEPRAVLGALLAFLGTSRAEMVLVALEDLWLELEQQNDPSRPDRSDTPNFARRAALSLDDAEADGDINALLVRLDTARRHGLVEV
jgi:4-alpha-glucanotransferase